MTPSLDLLTEPLLSWRDARHRLATTTLPGILARLASGDLADFPRVRAHQFHPWSMFLTQLGAVALRHSGEPDPHLSEDQWRERLLALTDGSPAPWCLVVDDLAQPAFLQPPIPEGDVVRWKTSTHPDDLDVLLTARAHDVKTALIAPDDNEAWVYALVTLQTMQGYPGRGYNGIARMKGGYGNRARVGLAADSSASTRFIRDLRVLGDTWFKLLERGYREDGYALTWTPPWDGTTSLSLSELTPHFIEICWRLRCRNSSVGLTCAYTTTTVRRCLAEVTNGDVGDPWLPVHRAKGALTIGKSGFHYGLLTELLFEADYEHAATQALREDDPDLMCMSLWAMVRGMGKTEGLHERLLPLSGPVRRLLGDDEGRALLGRRARHAVLASDLMRRKVLFPALKQLASGDHVVSDYFSARVNDVFFEKLFGSIEDNDETTHLTWDQTLRDVAWQELQSAIDRCSVPTAQRYRAISESERVFRGSLKRHFSDLIQHEANKTSGATR